MFPQLLNIHDDVDVDGDPGQQWLRNFIRHHNECGSRHQKKAQTEKELL